MATGSALYSRRREDELQCCQRRLDYLSSRLQDLAVELGDGQGAMWFKQNMWFLNKPALFFDDILFSVGKICNHLVSYLTFNKQRISSNFPFLSFMGILYEVGEILGIVRDLLLVNPKESLSVKQSQIELFWNDCTPFLFIFENSNHLLLGTSQIPSYIRALLDLVPTVIQVGMCMYSTEDIQMRGFDSFADTCLRLSRALVETGDFLSTAERMEPVIVPFLRQWIIYALELVQSGVRVRTDNALTVSPRLKKLFSRQESVTSQDDSVFEPPEDDTIPKTLNALSLSTSSLFYQGRQEKVLFGKRLMTRLFSRQESVTSQDVSVFEPPEDDTIPKTLNALSLSTSSSVPDEIAEASLAPLKIHNSSSVRVSCQPFIWIGAAKTRLVTCPNELRKGMLEEIGLRENQKLVSDIYVLAGHPLASWKGVYIHCPLTKTYDEQRIRLFVKVKVNERWEEREAYYQSVFGKGYFLSFKGCKMEAFVGIEERPEVIKDLDNSGGTLVTDFDPNLEAVIPSGTLSKSSRVRMMVQPADRPRERQYRDTCPEVFQHIQTTSHAIELDGANVSSDGNISIKIPFDILKNTNSKVLVLRYTNDNIEIRDGADILQQADGGCFTVASQNGGTVLATVDNETSTVGKETNIRNEMEVILGKKQMCKLLIFVEHQQNTQTENDVNMAQIVFSIACAEKYRISDVIREKTKVGLLELPKSQSPDRLLKQGDDITLEIRGGVKLDPDIPDDAYTLTYLEGSDNYFRFPVSVTDPDGKVTFVLRSGKDRQLLHTFFISIYELLALIVRGRLPTPPYSTFDADVFDDAANIKQLEEIAEKETDVVKDLKEIKTSRSHPMGLKRMSTSSEIIQGEIQQGLQRDLNREASLKILNRNSLVVLAKYLSKDEGNFLGVCLGLKLERVCQIYRMYPHSAALATFYVLYEWRGRQTQPELADQLIRGLQDTRRQDLASIVTSVRQQNRGLQADDFSSLDVTPTSNGRHRSRRS